MPSFLKLRTERDKRDEPVAEDGDAGPPLTPVSDTTITVVGSIGKDRDDMTEIDAIWKDVQDRVLQLAGGDSRKIRRDLDIAGVIQYLEQSKQKDQATQANYGWIKDKFSKTLQCISTVGGIVADGASYAFAPAQTCYNALTFVIQAWQGYEGIFENLAELFDKCTDFLERLEEYGRWMDAKLKRVACQHLQLFVAICDRSIRLRRKHVKLMAFTKMLFLNDNGIKDLLGMMERLVDKERNLVTAQVFNFTNEISQNVGALIEGEIQRKKEADTKLWKSTLVNALGFEQSMLDRDKEPIPTWTKTFTNLKDSLIEGTGKWILNDPVFDSWVRSRDSSNPLLVLHGDEGAGKTYMMANVLRYLPKLEGLTTRPALAHFFMDSDSKRFESKENTLATVSRSLLWQCASASEALTKSMAAICDKDRNFDDTLDLWTRLFFDNKDRQRMETTFYIAIDGLDEDIQPILPLLQKIVSMPTSGLKIRILLTAKTRTLESLATANGINFDSIAVSDNNNEDIEAYITHRMNSMDILKDETRPGISDWRTKILETLRDKTAGDYFKLVTNLDSIAKKDLVEDIEDVLENADKTRTDQIDSEIARLNKNLTVKEISEVNEIILWLITGTEWPSLSEVEAVLALKHGGGSMSTSLLPLELKLKTKYPLFQVSQSGWVQWKSDEIEGRIPKKTFDTKDDTSSSGFKDIQESEVAIVEHFLKQVCPPDIFDKFEFKQFFDRKRMARVKNFICWDGDNAHISIALTCLRVLTEQRNDRTEELKQYAGSYLLTHLRGVDLSLADRGLKSQVGQLLLQLFTTEYGIDSLFWLKGAVMSLKTWMAGEYVWLADGRGMWLYGSDGMEELKRWFKDSAVVKGIEDEEHKRLLEAFNVPDANPHEVLLKPAAKHLTAHLLRHNGFSMREANTTMFFLLGYISKLNDTPEDERYSSDSWSTTMSFMNRVENWAKSVFDEDAVDSMWEAQMAFTIADMCTDSNAEEVAKARGDKAMELDPNNWLACQFVASHADRDEEGNKKAVSVHEQAIVKINSLVEDGDTWLEDRQNRTLFAFMHLELGNRYWDLGEDYGKAAETQRKSLRYSQSLFSLYGGVFSRYRDNQSWEAAMDFLNALNEAQNWLEYFDELVNDLILDDTFQTTLALAADATDRWEVVEKLFNQAIDLAVKLDSNAELFRLRSAFGFTLGKSDKKEDNLITMWEAALGGGIPLVAAGEEVTKGELFTIIDPLARVYLKRGIMANAALADTKKYGEKLTGLLQDVDAWSNCLVSCCLARFHHVWGEKEEANKAINGAMVAIMEMLSDDDPSNDLYALIYLARVITSFADEVNTIAVWQTINLIVQEQVDTRRQWETTRDAKEAARQAEAEASVAEGEKTGEDAAAGEGGDAQEAPEQSAAPEKTINGADEVDSDAERQSSEAAGEKTDQPSTIDEHPAGSGNTTVEVGEAAEAKSEVGNRSRSASVSSSVTQQPEEDPEPPVAPMLILCDGCGEDWHYVSDAYTCADCVGMVQFDAKCHELLMSGGLSKKICDKGHEFIYVPKWDEDKAAHVPKGSVPVGEGIVAFEEWKKQLKARYMAESSDVREERD